jgi:hypothetical protein
MIIIWHMRLNLPFIISLIISSVTISYGQVDIQKINTLSGNEITIVDMDNYLKAQMDSFGLPGLSMALINDAKIVYSRTFGVTNVDTKEKVTEETLFDAGSMSKTPFTYLVMKMVEKGILNLDQPLYTYLPYPDIAYDDRYKLITARMVLSHTSGFPNWRFFNKDNKLDIKFTPGTQYLYSGEGFEYLAKMTFRIYFRQKFLLLWECKMPIIHGMTTYKNIVQLGMLMARCYPQNGV